MGIEEHKMNYEILNKQPGFKFKFPEITLLKSFFKIASRNLTKNKITTLINIIGLSIGIAGCIFAFMMVQRHYNLDAFHLNADEIFVVENVITCKGEEQLWGNSPVPLGPALKKDFPQIRSFVRINRHLVSVRRGDNLFKETIHFVDDEFLEMFTFPLKYGSKDVLSDSNAVVLEEKTARRYFGKRNPIGEELTFIFNHSPGKIHKESFIVRGVTKELPKTASFRFDFLVNYKIQFRLQLLEQNNWQQLTNATFIRLKDADEIEAIAVNMKKYIHIQNAADTNRPMSGFVCKNLRQMGRSTYNTRGSLANISLHPSQVLQLPISSLILLLLVCFNYMNTSIAAAEKRFKEIALRKVVGSSRLQLVFQFLAENIMLCMIALPLGIIFTEMVILPSFHAAFGNFFNLRILDLTSEASFWLFLLGLLLVTGFTAGAYPSFYISSFQPVQIFRGRQGLKGKHTFSKILLATQLVFSFFAIVTGIVFIQNSIYQNNLDWGYDKEKVLVVPMDYRYHKMFKDKIARLSNVLSTAGAREHIGKSYSQTIIKTRKTAAGGETNNYTVVSFGVGFDYMEIMGLRLKQGRFFQKELQTDEHRSIMVNETFAARLGRQNAIGQEVFIDDKALIIIGVVEDFHYRVFDKKIEPVLLRIAPEESYNFLTIKVRPGTSQQTAEYCKTTWKQMVPDEPYPGFFQEDVFAVYLQIMDNLMIINAAWALIFMFITCIGLYGLVSFKIAQRMKEISIRKILGASLMEIFRLVFFEFIGLIIIASLIALPSIYFLLNFFLDVLIEYNSGVPPLSLVLAFITVFTASLLTASLKVHKLATTNPVQTLRTD
jgi:putative ABC transport system permease protein